MASELDPKIEVLEPLSRIKFPWNATSMEHLLECPVCTELMTGVVHLCMRGHSLCHSCHLKVVHCPLCRNPVSLLARNYFMESLVEHLVFRCRFADSGCPDQVNGHAYSCHIKECGFRDVCCDTVIMSDCVMGPIPYCEFIQHLKRVHDIRTLRNGFQLHRRYWKGAEMDTTRLPFAIVELDGITFFYHCQVHTLTEGDPETSNTFPFFLFWWISAFATDEVCSAYRCTINVYSRKDKTKKLSWTGPVQNFRLSSSQIFNSGQFLMASSSTLASMCYSDKENSRYLNSYEENALIFKSNPSKFAKHDAN